MPGDCSYTDCKQSEVLCPWAGQGEQCSATSLVPPVAPTGGITVHNTVHYTCADQSLVFLHVQDVYSTVVAIVDKRVKRDAASGRSEAVKVGPAPLPIPTALGALALQLPIPAAQPCVLQHSWHDRPVRPCFE